MGGTRSVLLVLAAGMEAEWPRQAASAGSVHDSPTVAGATGRPDSEMTCASQDAVRSSMGQQSGAGFRSLPVAQHQGHRSGGGVIPPERSAAGLTPSAARRWHDAKAIGAESPHRPKGWFLVGLGAVLRFASGIRPTTAETSGQGRPAQYEPAKTLQTTDCK